MAPRANVPVAASHSDNPVPIIHYTRDLGMHPAITL